MSTGVSRASAVFMPPYCGVLTNDVQSVANRPPATQDRIAVPRSFPHRYSIPPLLVAAGAVHRPPSGRRPFHFFDRYRSRWGWVMRSINPPVGRTVLIVEDELGIARELHDVLRASGASILTATTIKDALHLIGYAQIYAAIVDVNLRDEDCSSVCAALARRSIPFMFYTGYSTAPSWAAIGKQAASHPIVETVTRLVQADLHRALSGRRCD